MKPKKKYGKALWTQLPKYLVAKVIQDKREETRKFWKKFDKVASAGAWRKVRIRQVSATMKLKRKEYSRIRGQWLNAEENKMCHVCKANPSTDIHHKKGRGKYLCATETWLAVCRTCHRHIHNNPKWAYEKGYLIKR